MQGNWKDLLSFNKRERNGILVLSTLISLLIFVQFAMNFIPVKEVKINTSYMIAFTKQLQQDSVKWRSEQDVNRAREYGYAKENVANKPLQKQILKPRSFDPNVGTYEDWISLGLNRGQIKSIKKFLDKGGEFRSVKDVSKMYVIGDAQYIQIKQYLLIPAIGKSQISYTESDDKVKTKSAESDSIMIELNSADTTELVKLKGIGSYYARQIVYYRDKLGGFYTLDQLYEVERMREETVQKIWPFVRVDISLITKVHINEAKASVMVKHPYITWNMAVKIQEQRDFGHKYKSVIELVELGLLSEELYLKLVPYLEL